MHYQVKAQMLAPVIREGCLDGWVSVHEARSRRTSSDTDQASIAHAANFVVIELGKAGRSSA
jgi:hypothetical protein